MKFKNLISQLIQELNRPLTQEEYNLMNIAYSQGKQDEHEEIISLLKELKRYKSPSK